jgi:hypothetical protein
MADIRPDRLTTCQSERRKSIVSRRPRVLSWDLTEGTEENDENTQPEQPATVIFKIQQSLYYCDPHVCDYVRFYCRVVSESAGRLGVYIASIFMVEG